MDSLTEPTDSMQTYDPAKSPYRMGGSPQQRYAHSNYRLKKQVMKLIGSAVRIYGPDGQLMFYVERKAFKIKDDIRVYADEAKTMELLSISARQMFDLFGTFDVKDSVSGATVGTLQRKLLASAIRDEWTVLDQAGTQCGRLFEESLALALVRRFIIALIPQSYDVEHMGTKVADFKQKFGLWGYEMDLEFSSTAPSHYDRRLGIASAVLLSLIEGRQR
ncbi:MAG: hypothetical protein QOJ65_210 [Fimbriimonadaceae bacterium]|jgi:uncharacterized protein YxjI|nr:hypothetical protein [Fimbriimonadaceae bacterium]